uniref:Uncharacterized protein n=1 Tax=Timema tahoe TaxID=61484 RepID=A0A7R9NV40_9NEOP|nr:unnamed protein product [Timema tahoe]
MRDISGNVSNGGSGRSRIRAKAVIRMDRMRNERVRGIIEEEPMLDRIEKGGKYWIIGRRRGGEVKGIQRKEEKGGKDWIIVEEGRKDYRGKRRREENTGSLWWWGGRITEERGEGRKRLGHLQEERWWRERNTEERGERRKRLDHCGGGDVVGRKDYRGKRRREEKTGSLWRRGGRIQTDPASEIPLHCYPYKSDSWLICPCHCKRAVLQVLHCVDTPVARQPPATLPRPGIRGGDGCPAKSRATPKKSLTGEEACGSRSHNSPLPRLLSFSLSLARLSPLGSVERETRLQLRTASYYPFGLYA